MAARKKPAAKAVASKTDVKKRGKINVEEQIIVTLPNGSKDILTYEEARDLQDALSNITDY
jgi:hypothetical protein